MVSNEEPEYNTGNEDYSDLSNEEKFSCEDETDYVAMPSLEGPNSSAPSG